MAKLIVAEKARAGLRHAVARRNVTGRTKERIAQSKWARAGSLAIVDEPQVTRLVSFRPMPCCLSPVLHLLCFVSLPLSVSFFSFLFLPFLLLLGHVTFSEYFLYHYRFIFVWRVRGTFFSP